jgi:type IV pilus assembly protein PilQ
MAFISLSLGAVFVVSLTSPSMAIAGQHSPAVEIKSIEFVEGDGHPVVKILAKGPIEYSCRELPGGKGLKMMLNGMLASGLEGEIPVQYSGISSVRAVQDDLSDEPKTEITIFTEDRRSFLVEEKEGMLVVHIKNPPAPEKEAGGLTASPSDGIRDHGDSKGPKAIKAATAQDPSRAKRIVDLKIYEEEDSLKAAIVCDGELGGFRAFTLKVPRRLVVDIAGVRNGLGKSVIPLSGKMISRVRLGAYPHKVRVVFDLDPPSEGPPWYHVEKRGEKILLTLFRRPQKEVNPNSGAQVAKAEGAPEDPKSIERKTVATEKDSSQSHTEAAENAGSKAVMAEATPADAERGEENQRRNPTTAKSPAPIKLEARKTPIADSGGVIPAAATATLDPKARLTPSEMTALEELRPFEISTGMEPGKVYTGQRINLDFQDIDIHNVFRLLAEVSGLNIVVSEKVKGKITMHLKDVPWDQALDLILSTHKLGMVRQGNVLRIATLKELIEEQRARKRLYEEKLKEKIEQKKRIEEAQIERLKRQRALRPFITKSFVLNYTDAKDVSNQIKGFLTREEDIKKFGSVIIDERTNTLTVTDYPERIEFIEEYIKRIDKPTPQVLIEARIVKANKNFARELGIQWGGQYAEREKGGEWAYGISSGLGSTLGPSTWTSGSFSGGTGADFIPLSGWMVNLPASLILGSATPAIGFQVGRLVGDIVNLDLRLSAAESEGLTKIISKPKIMTLDNVQATISQGFEIPFTQVNPEGNVSVVFKEATLKTVVTPLISPDGRVRLKLEVTDDFPDFTRVNQTTGDPAIRKRSASTEVLVRNGETVVIGGIMEETRSFTEAGVPWLRDVPVLSWLFERKYRSFDQTELLIFITPFIVESK